MGYERYLQNTDPRGDYEAHDDFGPSGRRFPRESDWDRGDRSSSAGRYELEGNAGRGRGNRYAPRSAGGDYRGSYASDGRRFVEGDGNSSRGGGWSSYGERPDNAPLGDRYGYRQSQGGQQPGRDQGYDYDDRGFMARAGDEVRYWFGDDEAEQRRMLDQRYDERLSGREAREGDSNYDSWRRKQIEALDRDYDEYRRENQSKFHSEFSSWREERQGQRSSLSKVQEHMEVVGSDGAHVGTVDKVRGDRIVLTKNDENADGHHHSIPSRWIESVSDKIQIRKTADEAMAHWRDEDRNKAFFDHDQHDPATLSTMSRSYTGY